MAKIPESMRETVDAEPMFQHPETTRTSRPGHADFIPKCITDKKYPLMATLVVTTLLIVIIALAARKPQPCSPCPLPPDAACPDHWIGYHGKCYYRSEDERDWNKSEEICSSFGATLALIDSQWDLNFLLNLTHPVHHWIGLLRQNDQTLKWLNGTEFRKLLQLTDANSWESSVLQLRTSFHICNGELRKIAPFPAQLGKEEEKSAIFCLPFCNAELKSLAFEETSSLSPICSAEIQSLASVSAQLGQEGIFLFTLLVLLSVAILLRVECGSDPTHS